MKHLFLLSICLSFFSEGLFAHARWSPTGTIKPRSNSSGIKSGPCGTDARTAPTVLNPGATVTLQWEETINHPGRFEIYFSQANDAGWTLLKTVNDTLDDNSVPHQYSTTVTLPNVNCSGCTLQLIQVMTENPASPSLYYSCADIQLGVASPPAPGPTPPPPPSPSPPTCP